MSVRDRLNPEMAAWMLVHAEEPALTPERSPTAVMPATADVQSGCQWICVPCRLEHLGHTWLGSADQCAKT